MRRILVILMTALAMLSVSTTPTYATTTHRLRSQCEARQFGAHLMWYQADATYQHVGRYETYRKVTRLRYWQEKSPGPMQDTYLTIRLQRNVSGYWQTLETDTRVMRNAGWYEHTDDGEDITNDPYRGIEGRSTHVVYQPRLFMTFRLRLWLRPDASCNQYVPLDLL